MVRSCLSDSMAYHPAMDLLLFRHGIAEPSSAAVDDADRALTDEGRDRTRAAARGLLRLLPGIDLILTSPKVRARQTAELLSEVMGVKPRVLDALGEGSIRDVAAALADLEEPIVAVVGHEPQLSLLAEYLLGGPDANAFLILKKASAALLEVGECRDPGSANLLWSVPPRALRLLATAAESYMPQTSTLVPIRRLHAHRRWVNDRLRDAAEQLTDEQLDQPFEIGMGSIRSTLTHLYAAEYVWLEALRSNPTPPAPASIRFPDTATGLDAWRALENHWQDYLDQLTEEALDQPVAKVSTSSGAGRRFETPRLDVLLHVCTHAQYTTAQAINMMRRVGVPAQALPDSMLITMSREQRV